MHKLYKTSIKERLEDFHFKNCLHSQEQSKNNKLRKANNVSRAP